MNTETSSFFWGSWTQVLLVQRPYVRPHILKQVSLSVPVETGRGNDVGERARVNLSRTNSLQTDPFFLGVHTSLYIHIPGVARRKPKVMVRSNALHRSEIPRQVRFPVPPWPCAVSVWNCFIRHRWFVDKCNKLGQRINIRPPKQLPDMGESTVDETSERII